MIRFTHAVDHLLRADVHPHALTRTPRLWATLLVTLVLLAACGGSDAPAETPADSSPVDTPVVAEGFDPNSTPDAAAGASTPAPPAEAAPTQDIIVPPPDIAEPGPAAAVAPLERNAM